MLSKFDKRLSLCMLFEKKIARNEPASSSDPTTPQPNSLENDHSIILILLEQPRSFLFFQWVRIRIWRMPFAHRLQLFLLW